VTLNPVKATNEVAREALASRSSPRRPTNMREMVRIIFCRRLPTASGVASRSCVLTLLITTSLSSSSTLEREDAGARDGEDGGGGYSRGWRRLVPPAAPIRLGGGRRGFCENDTNRRSGRAEVLFAIYAATIDLTMDDLHLICARGEACAPDTLSCIGARAARVDLCGVGSS
jgi:hypothetical protein